MKDDAFHDLASGSVRFWVAVPGGHIGASIAAEVLRYRYHPSGPVAAPLLTYLDHMDEIDDAVRRRSASGSREPIMVRAPDFI